MARVATLSLAPTLGAALADSRVRATLITVGLGEALVQLALTPVTAVIPDLAAAQGVGATEGAWLLTAYILALAGTLLVAGSLGDLLGHRRLFGVGAITYALASLGAGLAPGFAELLAMRALQGVGAAMVSGNNLAILTTAVPAAHQGKAIALVMSASALAAVAGSAAGTAVVAQGAWPVLFLGVVPLGLWAAVRARQLPAAARTGPSPRIDWLGALLLVTTTTLLAVALAHPHGATSETLLPLFHGALPAGAAGAAVLLLIVERRARPPLLPWSRLRNRAFAVAVGVNGVLHMTMMAALFLGPLLAVQGLGLSTAAGGALLVVVQASVVASTLAGGWLYDRVRVGWPRTAALVALTAALAAWALAGIVGNYGALLAIAALAGAASGLLATVNNTMLMHSLPGSARGVASGMLETTRHFGHAFGVTIPAALLAFVATGNGDDSQVLRSGFALACITMAGIAGLATVISRRA